jgi:hypothetical protein
MKTRVPMRRSGKVPRRKSESVAPLMFWILVILGTCCLGEILRRVGW